MTVGHSLGLPQRQPRQSRLAIEPFRTAAAGGDTSAREGCSQRGREDPQRSGGGGLRSHRRDPQRRWDA
jgi:hypothetical protein